MVTRTTFPRCAGLGALPLPYNGFPRPVGSGSKVEYEEFDSFELLLAARLDGVAVARTDDGFYVHAADRWQFYSMAQLQPPAR
jgi:hypothetical protein